MTSQVAVYNLNGIAIASDTVAMQTSERGSKTTGNAEKIYEIGAKHQVLALHYGSTGLNDLHHQFHFSEWARTLTEPLPFLSDYLRAYVEWTNTAPKLHSDESENREMNYYIDNHVEELDRRIMNEWQAPEGFDALSEEEQIARFDSFVESICQQGLDYLKGLPLYEGVTDEKIKTALKASDVDLDQIIKVNCTDYALSKKATQIVKRSAPLVLSRKQYMPTDSFLAFIGFGTNDAFASVQVLICRGIYGGGFKVSLDALNRVGTGAKQSYISTFAQSEAIDGFLWQYNADILNRAVWKARKHAGEVLGEAAGEAPGQIAAAVREDIESYAYRTYASPILRRVAGMNLHGLSELAKSLVGMQAIFSESQDGPVSVGGLIEVVTIDRTNGIQWKVRLPR